MFFRNLTMFTFPTSMAIVDNPDLPLVDALADVKLKPVGPLELSSRGFVSPFGLDDGILFHQLSNAIFLTLGGEDKIIPAAAVNKLLRERVAVIEKREGRTLGGRARRQMKEDLVHELLPKALVQPYRLNGYLDLELGILFVDTASRKQAEAFVSEIRRALGSFPALPINAEVPPRGVMTSWLAEANGISPMPIKLTLGDECELRDPSDNGAVAKLSREELSSHDVQAHLESGKVANKLALTYDDHLSFVMADDLVVRKLKFLDGAVDSLNSEEREDVFAEFDARFTLMVAELRRLFRTLRSGFQITKGEA